ncbi:MAG TPA: M48 family metallopeptidase [Candidatus Pacearchaeota archaeon]|nr:M48 family metallopeptidase [Candidatus Pacearchaeota archaeon]
MATLYTNADKNIGKTWILMSLFLVLFLAVGWALSYNYDNAGIFYVFSLFGIGGNITAYYFSDTIALKMTKAKPIEFQKNTEIYRLIDNLCIAAGLPMPKTYIIEEQQPNAFATGRDPQHSAIVLTQGLIETLKKQELEGVIAHELSHIKNRDTLIQCVSVVLVGIFSMISDLVLRLRVDDDNDRQGGGILMVLGLILVIFSPLIAQLLHFAISRKREFLADASAGLLTRNPEGLASALEKISRSDAKLKAANNITAHLFIASPFKGRKVNNWLVKLFSTHPPIEERIKALVTPQ